ncbi:MAG: hypothetical protein ACYCZX_10425 [Rhodospirillaceae bacterium]
MIRAKRTIIRRFAGGFAGACIGTALTAISALAAAEKLPPCEPDKPIPKGGCMAPKDAPTPLDQLRPAPPLTVPPGVAPPAVPAPPGVPPPIVPIPPAPPAAPALPPSNDGPAVIKPPPTGDSEIVKPPPQADSKMPVIKPRKNPEPRT